MAVKKKVPVQTSMPHTHTVAPVPKDVPPAPMSRVRVRLPHTLHPAQPLGWGFITDTLPSGHQCVAVLAGSMISSQLVSVPRRDRDVADEKEGWWEPAELHGAMG